MYLKLFMNFSWVCDIYFWQTSNYEMSFPKGGDENPCILNNNDKLLISSFMSMDWKLSWVYLWFSSMYIITSNDNILIFFVLFVCSNVIKYDLNNELVNSFFVKTLAWNYSLFHL
jgi:hypothetical protein